MNKLPKIFIGSSKESAKYIDTIEGFIKDVVELNSWKKVFNPVLGNYLHDIISGIEKSNCALFIFASDDKREKRGQEDLITRDNVVFETGIAIGLFGKERVFIIAEDSTALPTDFDGLTVFKIKADSKGDYTNSLQDETLRLKAKIIELSNLINKTPVYLGEFVLEKIKKEVLNAKIIYAISPSLSSFLDNHESDIRNRLSDKINPLEKFIAVIRDPDGNTLGLIAKHNNSIIETNAVHKKISASISILTELKHEFPDKIEIRVIDHPFMCSSFIFDPNTNCKICVQYNPFGKTDRLPQLYVPSSKPFWNDFYLKQGLEYYNNSKHYPAKYATLILNKSCEFPEKQSVLALWEEGYKTNGFRGKTNALEKIKKDNLLILAKDNDKLIGFSIIEKNGKRCATVVNESYRRKRIATELVRISLGIIPNQYSEIHLYSENMQCILLKNGFNRVSSESEVKKILKKPDITTEYDKEKDLLSYRRKTSRDTEDCFILYKKNL